MGSLNFGYQLRQSQRANARKPRNFTYTLNLYELLLIKNHYQLVVKCCRVWKLLRQALQKNLSDKLNFEVFERSEFNDS